jgi:hypothetical protein
MLSYVKSTAMAGLGLAMLAAVATPASADRSGDIAAGVIGGAIVGGIIGQATAGNPPPRPVYVAPRRGCGELRERAQYAEERGYYERARHLWREYRICRGD